VYYRKAEKDTPLWARSGTCTMASHLACISNSAARVKSLLSLQFLVCRYGEIYVQIEGVIRAATWPANVV